jgi:hypothetical protein
MIAAMTAALMMVGLFASTALANPNTFKSGPYASSGPDSGTCGNNWANDTYNRIFTVNLTPNTDGTYNVVETFGQGHFVTVAGSSPGACETNSPDPAGQIKAGVTGSFNGTLTIVEAGGTFDPTASCSNPCTTAGWVAAFFPGSTYTTPAFSFQYNAPAKGLTFHQWTNADTGNFGDIASS